jgi:anti-sigma factor RsiW
MACRSPAEVVELLGPAACDVLNADERDRLERHLADCPDCREELDALRRVVRLLSSLRAPPR